MRLIDADNLSAFIGDERADFHNKQQTLRNMSEIEFNTRDYMLLYFQKVIDNAPTVDFTFEETFQKTICENRLYCPARPTGKWGKWVISEIQCPNCLEYFQTDCYSTEELNKCPICGAKMKGEEI